MLDEALVSGWGYTVARRHDEKTKAAYYPDSLMWAPVDIYSTEQCVQYYSDSPEVQKVARRSDMFW